MFSIPAGGLAEAGELPCSAVKCNDDRVGCFAGNASGERAVEENQPEYRAFISYSHADSALALWLHRAIEGYRVPTKLVGRETAIGIVPRRLIPIFKDREELAASGSLDDGLKAALAGSQFLIVVASPSAAASKWVDEEVRFYKQVHGEGRVLVALAAGEPFASNHSERCADECLPPSVRTRLAPGGSAETAPAEPLAADFRPGGDGKRLGKLKLVAGLTGLKLDDLVRREAQRRARRMRWIAIGASTVALLMTFLALAAIRARSEAERQRLEAVHQRAAADGLIEFMLTDLRKKLEPVGRLDALDVVGQRALAYYATQQPGTLDAASLGRRSRALHLVGEVRNLRGDSEHALIAFREAEAATAEMLARNPNDGQRIFDHAQSVFWVGLIAYERGLTQEAEREFRAYKRLAERLVMIDPSNADWRMEVSYAETNLGTLLLDKGLYHDAEAAFERALPEVEARLSHKPDDPASFIEAGQALSWIGRAQADQDHDDQAIATYRREADLYQKALKKDPKNASARRALIVASTMIGHREMARGDLPAARASFAQATEESASLLALDPSNSDVRVGAIKAQVALAETMRLSGDTSRASQIYSAAQQSLGELIKSDPKNVDWTVSMQSMLDLLGASLAESQGAAQRAFELANRGAERVARIAHVGDEDNSYFLAHLSLIAGDMAARLGHSALAKANWKRALAAIGSADAHRSSLKLAMRFAADLRLGHGAEMRAIAAILDERNFHNPIYEQQRRIMSG